MLAAKDANLTLPARVQTGIVSMYHADLSISQKHSFDLLVKSC